MSKRRKNQFREALDAKREALASAAKQPSQSRSGSRRPPSFAPRYWQTVSQSERPSSQKSRGGVVAWIRRSSWVGSVRSALTQSATR
jgi:hypothetical protein